MTAAEFDMPTTPVRFPNGIRTRVSARIVTEIFEVLERLKWEGTSILVVEQNARPVFEIAHRVSVLERGHIAMSGPPAELVGDVRVMERTSVAASEVLIEWRAGADDHSGG